MPPLFRYDGVGACTVVAPTKERLFRFQTADFDSFAQPVAPQIGDEEDSSCQAPADGIAQKQGFQRVEPDHHRHQPDHPEQAHSDTGDGSGDQRIPRSAHGTGEDLHRHKDRIKGHSPQHDVSTQPDHFRICGEDPQNGGAEDDFQSTQPANEHYAHAKAHPDAFSDPVIFLSAEVLPHEGGDGYTESTGNHPGQSIGFSVGGECCHGGGTKGVDAGLDQDIGKVKGNELQSGR